MVRPRTSPLAGSLEPSATRSAALAMFPQADRNHDGVVTLAEFFAQSLTFRDFTESIENIAQEIGNGKVTGDFHGPEAQMAGAGTWRTSSTCCCRH